MNKEFIPYEESLSLMRLGFDYEEYARYGERDGSVILCRKGMLCGGSFNSICTAPLFQQAFRFFRERYKIDIHTWEITECFKRYYLAEIIDDLSRTNLYNEDMSMTRFNSKEDAELACLKKLIEIVKQK